jgi:hypothetical protein
VTPDLVLRSSFSTNQQKSVQNDPCGAKGN